MPWDDTIAEAIDRNTSALKLVAKAINRAMDTLEPVIAEVMEGYRAEQATLSRQKPRRPGDRRRR